MFCGFVLSSFSILWVSEVAFDREHTDGFGEFYGTESWRQTEDVVY